MNINYKYNATRISNIDIKRLFNAIIVFLAAIFILVSVVEAGSVRVKGYTRKNGTYVAPHYRSSPDRNFYNNWSTKGNINPYTGKEGTRVTPPNRKPYQSGGDVLIKPSPERNFYNNWGTKRYINPYTGKP